MNIEGLVFNCLTGLVAGKCYRDFAPLGAPVRCITFAKVGGVSTNFLDQAAPGVTNSRVQVNSWDTSRDAATTLARDAEAALRAYSALQVEVLGEPVSVYEADTERYGCQQDFSCWSTP